MSESTPQNVYFTPPLLLFWKLALWGTITIKPNNQKNKIMTTADFTTSFEVDNSPDEVFHAVNNVRGWWSEEIEGPTDQLHGVFKYHYRDVHLCRIKVAELVPGKKVVWEVLDNYFNFTKDNHEWKGNKINFEIMEKGGKTELRFTQLGLVPSYECYDICRDAWGNFIGNSLRSLVTTGKGQPSARESEFNEQLLQKNEK